MKKIILLIVVILAGVGIYFATRGGDTGDKITVDKVATTTDEITTAVEHKEMTVLGKSVGGLDINAYHYGTGTTEILFVGGIHGGYEWNTSLVAYETIDYLKANPNKIPGNLKVTVVPVLNPDGLGKVVENPTAKFSATDITATQEEQVAGRFNGNNVDLNRNFDCDWQTEGKWQNKTVSGGSSAFSEPESQAIKNYIESKNPKAVVVWYSAAGGVFASNCHNDEVLPETLALTTLFSKASGYKAFESFDFYEITGDMVNWLAKKGIPGISVLLTNHTSTEWTKNQKGIQAVIDHYAE